MHRPRVWAEIDICQLKANFVACRRLLGQNINVLGVVKADAYGHGAVPVATALEGEGIPMLGVGDSHEAISLRESGIRAPILVLGAVVDGEIPELIHHRITPTIHSPQRVDAFNRVAREQGVSLPVHLLVDTGMNRLGVVPKRALEHIGSILRASNLHLAGVGTHLASPVEDPDFTQGQLQIFSDLVDEARRARVELPTLHALSSQAIEQYSDSQLDMVRLGGYLYGLSPRTLPEGIDPILSLHTQIVYLRDIDADTRVGYGGTHVTTVRTRLATLPVGYHDGYLHSLSNRAEVIVRGQRAPVIGRVTMDYITVDVSNIPDAGVGDRVTLIGRDEEHQITALDLATWAGTIPYEIPCHLGNRVRRFYHSSTPDPGSPLLREACE